MTSIRAATYNRWAQHHADALFIGGILLFWLIALCWYRDLTALRRDSRSLLL